MLRHNNGRSGCVLTNTLLSCGAAGGSLACRLSLSHADNAKIHAFGIYQKFGAECLCFRLAFKWLRAVMRPQLLGDCLDSVHVCSPLVIAQIVPLLLSKAK